MAYKENEKTLSSDIPMKLFEAFNKQRTQRGQVKKEAVRAMVQLWLQIPQEVQSKLMNQTTDSGSFTKLVRQIADEQIHKALKKKTSK
jgi:hypothetical protein